MIKATKLLEITDDEYHYTAGYYTTNKWIDNDSFVAARSKKPHMLLSVCDEPTELVKITLSTGEKKVLCNDSIGFVSYVVYKNLVYYSTGSEMKKINTDTGVITTLYKETEYTADKKTIMEMPEITSDGKYLSVYILRENLSTVFLRIDTETGEGVKMCEKLFGKPFYFANHGMICPTDPYKIFFAHEGNTRYISNRLWLYDAKKDEMRNIARQKFDSDNNLGDCFGHEMWAPDGKGLYFVKYIASILPPAGICYVDAETGEYDVLYSKYNYWHVGVSHDGRYLLSDTQYKENDSQVVVIDRQTNEEAVIDTVTATSHPAHPHPQMSPDNQKLIYTTLSADGKIYIKVVFLEYV